MLAGAAQGGRKQRRGRAAFGLPAWACSRPAAPMSQAPRLPPSQGAPKHGGDVALAEAAGRSDGRRGAQQAGVLVAQGPAAQQGADAAGGEGGIVGGTQVQPASCKHAARMLHAGRCPNTSPAHLAGSSKKAGEALTSVCGGGQQRRQGMRRAHSPQPLPALHCPARGPPLHHPPRRRGRWRQPSAHPGGAGSHNVWPAGGGACEGGGRERSAGHDCAPSRPPALACQPTKPPPCRCATSTQLTTHSRPSTSAGQALLPKASTLAERRVRRPRRSKPVELRSPARPAAGGRMRAAKSKRASERAVRAQARLRAAPARLPRPPLPLPSSCAAS